MPGYGIHEYISEWTVEDTSALLSAMRRDGSKLGQVMIGIACSVLRPSTIDPTGVMPVGLAISSRRFLPQSSEFSVGVGVSLVIVLIPVTEINPNLHPTGHETSGDFVLPSSEAGIKSQQSALATQLAEELPGMGLNAKVATQVPLVPFLSFLGPMDTSLTEKHGAILVSRPRFGPCTASPTLSFSSM